MKECISQPVHETGLCKNLLQEYAQKMNYAIPLYECWKDETPGRVSMFSCAVEIGGVKYIGAAARTKKEAEIKAARTALLAIQSSAPNEMSTEYAMYTVVPVKKKVTDLGITTQETAATLKPKKGRFKKKSHRLRHTADGTNHTQARNMAGLEANGDNKAGLELGRPGAPTIQIMNSGHPTAEGTLHFSRESSFGGSLEYGNLPGSNGGPVDPQLTSLSAHQSLYAPSSMGINFLVHGAGLTEVNDVSGAGQVTSMVNSSTTEE